MKSVPCYRLIHAPSGTSIAERIERADNLFQLGAGLLGRRALDPEAGLWLPGTALIHTLGMRFAIDVLFLDRQYRTVRSVARLKPGCWVCGARGARMTVELRAGALERLGAVVPGDTWLFEQV